MPRRRPRILTCAAALGLAACAEPGPSIVFPPRNPITSVSVYLPLYHVMQVGEAVRLDAAGYYQGNGAWVEEPRTVVFRSTDTTVVGLEPTTWYMSSMPSVRARARRVGTVTFSATINGVTGSDSLRVIPEIQSIALTPTRSTLQVGDTVAVTVDIVSTGGEAITTVRPFVDMSDGVGVVVSVGQNRFRGVAPGTARLKAFVGADTGRVTLTVVPKAP
jgi:hypothetical protein